MAGYGALNDLDNPIDDSPEAQLEFQNFVLSDNTKPPQYGKSPGAGAGGGVGGSGAGVPLASDPAFGFATLPPPVAAAAPAGQPGGFWTVEYYAQYFNVDTNDVLQRMLGTLLPNISFTDLIGTNPDLYGPFWIATTVIFSIFIASSVAGSLNALLRNGTYTPDMTILSVAVTTVYVFVTALPLAVWGVLRYYKGPASLLQMIDAWGYALTVWIPVSLLCIIPFDIVRWVLVVLAFASSFFFKIRTLRPLVSQTSNASVAQTTILGILLVTDLGLALLFKFYFYTFDVTSPGSGAGAGKGTTNATSFEVGVRGLSVGLGGSE